MPPQEGRILAVGTDFKESEFSELFELSHSQTRQTMKTQAPTPENPVCPNLKPQSLGQGCRAPCTAVPCTWDACPRAKTAVLPEPWVEYLRSKGCEGVGQKGLVFGP